MIVVGLPVAVPVISRATHQQLQRAHDQRAPGCKICTADPSKDFCTYNWARVSSAVRPSLLPSATRARSCCTRAHVSSGPGSTSALSRCEGRALRATLIDFRVRPKIDRSHTPESIAQCPESVQSKKPQTHANARFLKEPACADSVKLRLSLCLWQALQPSFARVPRGS